MLMFVRQLLCFSISVNHMCIKTIEYYVEMYDEHTFVVALVACTQLMYNNEETW